MKRDLLCFQCREQQSEWLLYFKKFYIFSRKLGIFDPMIICDKCAEQFKTSPRLFEHQPALIHFKTIAKMEIGKLMWLCSDKGKECNQLAYPVWRKKLLRIKKYTEGVLQIKTYWIPMAL